VQSARADCDWDDLAAVLGYKTGPRLSEKRAPSASRTRAEAVRVAYFVQIFPKAIDLKIRHNALILERKLLNNMAEEIIDVTDVATLAVAGVMGLACAKQLVEISFTVTLPAS
jgi:hypothetical protein